MNEDFEKALKEFESKHSTGSSGLVRKIARHFFAVGFAVRQPEIDTFTWEREEWIKKWFAVAEQVELLKEALRPFAAYADHYPTEKKYGNRPTTGEWHSVASGELGMVQIDVEDFHRAKAAIEETE